MVNLGLIFVAGITAVGADAPPPPVSVVIAAVQATLEDREEDFFDPMLKEVRPALSQLDYDTFHAIRLEKVQTPLNRETRFEINPKYTLFLKPLTRDRSGHVRIEVRIQMPPKKKGEEPINAVATTIRIEPGKQFMLRGLKLDKGELVVVIGLK